MKLLLVEDDRNLSQELKRALKRESFIVSNVASEAAAEEEFVFFQPDLVILDLGLPDIDGVHFLKFIRSRLNETPVLILTARDNLEDKIQALDIGADDYLVKPFEMSELLARLRAISRRLGTACSSEVVIGKVRLDTAGHRVLVEDKVISPPRKEYMTLKILMQNAGRVNTKDMLESKLYALGEEIGSNAIEVHISNLRKKLPEGFIKTIRGVGYTISQTNESV